MGYRGRCPICSAELQVEGSEVFCHVGHYRTPTSQFETRWEQFDQSILELTENLLNDLKLMNTVTENKSE